MKNILEKIIEKIKKHILYSVFFFKSYRLLGKEETYCRARQAIDDNMANVHCMLDTRVCKYKYTHSDCVIPIAFPKRSTRLKVTL